MTVITFPNIDNLAGHIKAAGQHILAEVAIPAANPVDIKGNKAEPEEIKHVLILLHKIDSESSNKPNSYR